MSSAFNWKPAWDAYPDDHPDFPGIRYYDLPHDASYTRRIYEGDRFWKADGRYIIEVEAVKTQVYRGVVGPLNEEGRDAVFYEPDWEPARDPATPTTYTDDIHFLYVDDFVEMLDEDDLVPHRGNGLRTPPY